MRRLTFLATGLLALTLGCGEDTDSPAGPDLRSAQVTAAAALAFAQVSSGDIHTCGITSDNRAYCWGWNVFGQLGDGTETQRLRPVAVKGGLRFRQISAGFYHSCGVTTENRAYCWGDNGSGEVGDGTTPDVGDRHLMPVAVAGGHLFRQVSAGAEHTCGVTMSDRVFCWGLNTMGQLGNGMHDPSGNGTTGPVAVTGTLRFRGVSVGVYHSCGVATDNRAYCWGGDRFGELGDGSGSGTCEFSGNMLPCRKRPTLVVGGHRFRQVDAGGGHGPGEGGVGGTDGGHTCGVTMADRAFCWGDGTHGQNGNGTFSMRSFPGLVAGGHSFRALSLGMHHSCGVTLNDRAYCWGWNTFGQLGDGTRTTRPRPRPVVDGHPFSQVSAGGGHTCGKTTGGVAYCWGSGSSGALGNGATSDRLRPRAVVGPM